MFKLINGLGCVLIVLRYTFLQRSRPCDVINDVMDDAVHRITYADSTLTSAQRHTAENITYIYSFLIRHASHYNIIVAYNYLNVTLTYCDILLLVTNIVSYSRKFVH